MTDVIIVSTPGLPIDILPFLPQIVPAVVAAIDFGTDPTRIKVVAAFDLSIDIAAPPAIANGIDLQTDDLVFIFAQDDPRQNGVWVYTADASLARALDYPAGGYFKAGTVRVQALFGDDYEGQIWELAADATVDLDPTVWAEVTDDYATLPNGTSQMGPASQRSVDTAAVKRRLVPTDLPLIKSRKSWRSIDLPLPYLVQQRPRLSWAGYVNAPWTMTQWLTLALREEAVIVWDVPLLLSSHLTLDSGIYGKTIIFELPPDTPAIIGKLPAASGISWLGQKLRFEGLFMAEARVPTIGDRAAFRFLPGCADIYMDTVVERGPWERAVDFVGVNKGDIDGVRINRLIAGGTTLGGGRAKGVRNLSIGWFESQSSAPGGGQKHFEVLDNCERVSIEGGRTRYGAQAVIVDASNAAAAPYAVDIGPFEAVAPSGIAFERVRGHHVTFHQPESNGAGAQGLVFRAGGGAAPRALRPHIHGSGSAGILIEGADFGQEITDAALHGNSATSPGTSAGIEIGPGADNVTVRGGFSGEVAAWAHAEAIFTFGGNIGEGKTLTIGTRVLTARLAPVGPYDFQRDATDRNISAAYLLAYLRASPDPEIIKCAWTLVASNQIGATYIDPGLPGNAFTVASDIAAGGWSSPTLVGGSETPAPIQKAAVEIKAPSGRNIRVALDDARGNIVGGVI